MADTTSTTPQTLLEAINELLRLVRISAVMSMDGVDNDVDASGARQALDDVAREVLLRGWEFNTEYSMVLSPDDDGIIGIPENALKVQMAKYQFDKRRLLVRQRKLYDNRQHTFVLNQQAIVDLVVALPFEDFPETIKRLVFATAAMRWCRTKLPSGATFQISGELIKQYELEAMQEEVDNRGVETLKDTSPHFAWNARRRN